MSISKNKIISTYDVYAGSEKLGIVQASSPEEALETARFYFPNRRPIRVERQANQPKFLMPTRKQEGETSEEWARRLAKVVYQRLQELSKNQ